MPILRIKKDSKWVNVPAMKGDTPVKGVDYWNEEDKEEVKEFIDNSVADLRETVEYILEILESGNLPISTVQQIEDTMVSYFENKTIKEVEG